MVNKYFQCYNCRYHNKFYNIPSYIKGKKCHRCHKFNFFNYHQKNKNKRNKIGHIVKKQFHNQQIQIRNILGNNTLFNNNNNNNNIINNFLGNNQREQNNVIRNIPHDNINVIPSFNSNYNSNFLLNDDSFDRDNTIQSNLVINDSHNNNILNDHEEFDDFSINKIPWLKKEKATNIIIKKYGKDNQCSICLETIKCHDVINITKCNHIFHYKCIEKAINRNILDCPNCRRNLKDGSNKPIINTINVFELNDNNYNNNNNNSNRYYSVGSSDNDRNGSISDEMCVKIFLCFFVIMMITKILSGLGSIFQ